MTKYAMIALVAAAVVASVFGPSRTTFASEAVGDMVRKSPLSSVSRITFSDDGNLLFAADWKSSKIYAFELPTADTSETETYNIMELDALLSEHLNGEGVDIVDVASRPGANQVYIAVTHGENAAPALLRVSGDAEVATLDLASLAVTSVDIADAPGELGFWGRIPARSLTVTDMKWYDGRLFVAGLSNQDFASTLRQYRYPFDGQSTVTTVEMYHTSHNQIETRAPIEVMTFAKLGDTPYMIAAYTCTPLVTVPVADLTDGAHVRGKTIAELGFGNAPAELVSYNIAEGHGAGDYVMLINYQRAADVMAVSAIEKANQGDGYSEPVGFGQVEGVDRQVAPLGGVTRLDNLNDRFFIALRTDIASGDKQLVTIDKQFRFRLSDFVSEYVFPDYAYKTGFQNDVMKPIQNVLKVQEGFSKDVVE